MPPYDNTGAKYDFPDDLIVSFGTFGGVNATEERLDDYLSDYDSDFDTYQRIQISNPTGVTDFVVDWRLWYSRDYLLEKNRQKSKFNTYR